MQDKAGRSSKGEKTMNKPTHSFITINITEPTPLSIGEIELVHQQCMSELITLRIKNALWCQFTAHNKLECEDVELVNFNILNGCYTGIFRVRNKIDVKQGVEEK